MTGGAKNAGADGVDPVDICEAARKGSIGEIEAAIARGADLNQAQEGMTPLMHAAYNHKPKAFSLLLSCGADPKLKGDQDETALHLCAGNGWSAECEELMDLGCDVNARTASMSTPLHYWANRSSDARTCEVLVRAGANLRALDKDDQDPLGRATYWDRGASTGLRDSSVNVAKLLIAYGSSRDQAPNGMESLSMVRAAAHCGATERVLELLGKPLFLDPADTPAAIAKEAIEHGHHETAAAVQAFAANQALLTIRSRTKKPIGP